MHQSMDVRTASEALGVSPHRVRQLIAQGELPAQRVGRFWLLDGRDVERRAQMDVPDGRPYAARQVWRMADLVDLSAREVGGDRLEAAFRETVGPQARWQLRQYLEDLASEDDVRIVSWRLRGRAERTIARFAHPSAHAGLVADPRVVLSGADAAAKHGHDLVPGTKVEVYLAPGDVDDVLRDHGLVEVPGDPNVRLQVSPEVSVWRDRRAGLPDEVQGVAPRLLVMADLSENDDARARAAAHETWASLRPRILRLAA